MLSVKFKGVGRIELEEDKEPAILTPDDVIIKVRMASICGSDLHIKNGLIPHVKPGTILGHEFVGTIIEKGSNVKKFKVGQRVIAPPAYFCGGCYYCVRGFMQYCKNGGIYGYNIDGAQAEYMRIINADLCLSLVPEDIEDEEALLIGDVLQTGFHAAYQAKIKPGDSIAVFGCGPIGIGSIISSWLFGPKEIFAIDVIEKRLEVAKGFGARTINPSKEDVLGVIRKETEGEGVDVAIEAVGLPETFIEALRALRKGGTLSVAGIFASSVEFPMKKYSQYGANIHMGLGQLSWIDRLVDLVEKRRIVLKGLITHVFSLKDAISAYENFEKKKEETFKVAIIP